MSTPAPPNGVRRTVASLIVAAVVLVVGVTAAAWRFGPRVGLHVTAPSPQEYAAEALGHLEEGYHAEGEAWESAKAQVHSAADQATSYEQVWPALDEAAKVAGGEQSGLVRPGEQPSPPRPDPMPTARSNNGITVHTLPPVTADAPPFNQKYADQLASNIDATRANTTCGTVLDMRGTTGGDMFPLLAGLAPLLPDEIVAGYRTRAGQDTWLGIEGSGLTRNGNYTFATYFTYAKLPGPVAVLQGRETSGAGEVALLALTDGRQARSFGEPTAGRNMITTEYRLYDDATLEVATAALTDSDGTTHDGPLAPHVPAPATAAEAEALRWLSQQCG